MRIATLRVMHLRISQRRLRRPGFERDHPNSPSPCRGYVSLNSNERAFPAGLLRRSALIQSVGASSRRGINSPNRCHRPSEATPWFGRLVGSHDRTDAALCDFYSIRLAEKFRSIDLLRSLLNPFTAWCPPPGGHQCTCLPAVTD